MKLNGEEQLSLTSGAQSRHAHAACARQQGWATGNEAQEETAAPARNAGVMLHVLLHCAFG